MIERQPSGVRSRRAARPKYPFAAIVKKYWTMPPLHSQQVAGDAVECIGR